MFLRKSYVFSMRSLVWIAAFLVRFYDCAFSCRLIIAISRIIFSFHGWFIVDSNIDQKFILAFLKTLINYYDFQNITLTKQKILIKFNSKN